MVPEGPGTASHSRPFVAGLRGAVPDVRTALARMEPIEDELDLKMQVLDADMVLGPEHLHAAFTAAVRGFARGRAKASETGPELTRYAGGQRQIGAALELMGVGKAHGEEERIAIIIWSADAQRAIAHGKHPEGEICNYGPAENALEALAGVMGWKRDDGVLTGDVFVLERFGIGEEERRLVGEKNWQGLVLEKVALADLVK